MKILASKTKRMIKRTRNYCMITIAALIYAIAISMFLDPNNIAPGGITGVAILINTFKKRENQNIYDIDLDIICEKANHKAIIIGKQGKALKETLTFARKDMENFLEAKVFLTAYVKVKKDWKDDTVALTDLGFSKKDI